MAKAQDKTAPPKKAEPAKKVDPPPKPWTTWVKFEHMDGKGGVEKTLPKVAAFKKGSVWWLRATDGPFASIREGDRVTLSDGTVIVVDRPTGSNASGKIPIEGHKLP